MIQGWGLTSLESRCPQALWGRQWQAAKSEQAEDLLLHGLIGQLCPSQGSALMPEGFLFGVSWEGCQGYPSS